MSDMECPFCQQAIVCIDAKAADEYATWFCPRCVAERNWCAFGTETLWQELIRTREVLGDTIKLAEEMLEDIEDEGMCSWQYREKLNKIKSITKGGDNE